MRDSRTVWLSVARQCGAAELRLVTWLYLLAVCCRVAHWSFPFLAHPSVFRFFDAVLFTCPSFFVVFLFVFPTCSHPLLARPFLDTIEPAGAPACSSGEWEWRPFGPRAKLRLRLVAPFGRSSAPLFVACVFVFVFWLSSPFFMRCLHMFFASHLFSRRRFSSYFPCVGLRDFSSIIAPAMLFMTVSVFVSRFPAFT